MLARTFRILAWCLASLLFLSFLAVVLSMEGKRRYTSELEVSAAAVREASRFVSRESRKIINAKQPIELKATQYEINDTVSLLHRSYERVSGSVTFEDNVASLRLSIKGSVLGIPTFFNIRGEITSSENGIQWKRAKIGDLPLGPRSSEWLFKRTIFIILGKKYGKEILMGIGTIQVKPKALSVRFTPQDGFQEGFAVAANRISGFLGENIQLNSERVQYYLDFLVDYTRKNSAEKRPVPFYLQVLFSEVKIQRETLGLKSESENTSAMYALAVQAAPGTFRHFVKDLKVNRLNATPIPKLTLAGREDLAKHFIYSAALKILSDKGLSFSIGEAKELIDASSGGSGFSFADLTADRAGIRFAEVISAHADTAQLIQEIAASGIQERDIFPPLHGLPEGLSELSFETLYSGIDSKKYKAMLEDIDKRLDACNLLSL